MRLEMLEGSGLETPSGELKREVGAAVARGDPGGGFVLELGPADGPPHLRLILSGAEAARLGAAIQGVVSRGGEEVVLSDD